jgi:hypothetical protein
MVLIFANLSCECLARIEGVHIKVSICGTIQLFSCPLYKRDGTDLFQCRIPIGFSEIDGSSIDQRAQYLPSAYVTSASE